MYVVSQEEMRNVDQYTITHIGLGGPVLMENAGRAVYEALKPEMTAGRKVTVVIGKGNNGGDGFVVARMLLDSAACVETWIAGDPKQITGDAAYHMKAYQASGGRIRQIRADEAAFAARLDRSELIVDALLGTGIHGAPYPEYMKIIDRINQARAEVVSIDLPSGVPANGTFFDYPAVRADRTLTLDSPKLAQFVQPGAGFFGAVRVLSIGIPQAAYRAAGIRRTVRRRSDVSGTLPVRDPFSHKGSHGKGLLIAGAPDMSGAAFFSAKAALRSGIGLLRLSVPESIHPVIAGLLPETMFLPRDQISLADIDGVAIGPGLGRTVREQALVRRVVEESSALPCVIDADALFHMRDALELLTKRMIPAVLTPHPGEMAMLTGVPVSEIENNRFAVTRAFAKRYHVYLVLKGKYTIITAPDGRQTVNTTGNAALAKGGSGDVLTGMLLAFLLQHAEMMDAVSNAVYVHGAAADELTASGHSQLDVLASDVIEAIPPVLHRLCGDTM